MACTRTFCKDTTQISNEIIIVKYHVGTAVKLRLFCIGVVRHFVDGSTHGITLGSRSRVKGIMTSLSFSNTLALKLKALLPNQGGLVAMGRRVNINGMCFGGIGIGIKEERWIVVDGRIGIVMSALGPKPKFDGSHLGSSNIHSSIGWTQWSIVISISPKEQDTGRIFRKGSKMVGLLLLPEVQKEWN